MAKRKVSKTYKKKLSKKSKTARNKTVKKGGSNFKSCRIHMSYMNERNKINKPCIVADHYKKLSDLNCSSMFKSKSKIDEIGKSAIKECSNKNPLSSFKPDDLSKRITWDDIDLSSMK